MPDRELIPISALNQYYYCAHRCFLIHVEQVFVHNEHTIAGVLEHKRADSGEVTKRDSLTQYRSVWLHSKKYGLTGKADLIEVIEESFSSKCIYPIEYKHGRRGQWDNDKLQLCAQALCLEDMLDLHDPISTGYIYYARDGRREEISIDDELRKFTIETIDSAHTLISNGVAPPAVHTPRCKGCSLHGICLPRETDMLRKAILNQRTDASNSARQ